jgi:RNA polymerase-binding transcription factor DksA
MDRNDELRRAMLERLAELDDRLHDIEEELDSHQSRDWSELATERESDEVLERLGTSGQQEIARIKAALARMDEGTYGICVRCEEPIPQERLRLLPFTPLCASCAAGEA